MNILNQEGGSGKNCEIRNFITSLLLLGLPS